MVPSHQKPVKERALSKSNQARPVGKKKLHVKASYASEDEDTTFTPEWNDCRRNITDALIWCKKLRKDKELRDKFSNQHKMSPRCRGLAFDSRVANILKGSIMVSSRPKRVKEGPLSKSKQARHAVGKVVRHVKVHPRGICSNQQTAFTPEWYECRSAIKEALRCYRRLLSDKDYRERISKDHGMGLERGKPSGMGQHMRLAKLVRCLGKWVNTAKQIGCVGGIEVGDGFHWRGELCIVGLHSEFQKGIDCITSLNGSKIWATSIVDSGRYDSSTRKVSSDEFTYCGEGENPSFCGFKKLKDQKLVGGNRALRNNMIDRKPVRVIRRFDNIGNTNESGYKFVYEGLYQVMHCWKEIRMDTRKYVYKFNLVKLEDHLQYEPQWKVDNVRTRRYH